MEDMEVKEVTYKITLTDGTVIENLKKNGNNYISSAEIDAAIFEENCSPVIINDGESDEVHDHMALIHLTEYSEEYWFALRDLSARELKETQMEADLEYLAMMTGVEL